MKSTLLFKLLIINAILILSACIGGGGGNDGENSTDSDSASEIVDRGDFISTAYPSELGYVIIDENGNTQSFQQFFNDFGRAFDETANAWLKLPKGDIRISFMDCGIINAFYDPDNAEVIMCYDLLIEFSIFFGDDGIKGSKAFLFTFFHELGHALVDQQDWKILGNQESAVDSFATVAVVDAAMPEAAIFAGFFFLTGNSSWTDEHDIGEVRLGNLACWAIGGAPQLLLDPTIKGIADQLYESGRDCPDEYEKQREAANENLAPFEKSGHNRLFNLKELY